jgi:hypothetical protein
MATPAMSSAGVSTSQSSRGKDQLPWSADTWARLDQAATSQMAASRQCASFLPQVLKQKHEAFVNSDIVIFPPAPPASPQGIFDASLSIDETQFTRIHEYQATLRLTMAQVVAEEQQQPQVQTASQAAGTGASPQAQPASVQSAPSPLVQRGSTAHSLVLRTAIPLAQAEDAIILTGSLGYACSPLFVNQLVQSVDPNLATVLDLGLMSIQQIAPGATGNPSSTQPANVIMVPAQLLQAPVTQTLRAQVVVVNPSSSSTPDPLPQYREETLAGVASAISMLQANGHYTNYAGIFSSYIYADLHSALPQTLVEPAEPIGHILNSIVGTGAMPPFTSLTIPTPTTPVPGQPPATGLPTLIQTITPGSPNPTSTIQTLAAAGLTNANVLFTGLIVSTEGRTMDIVRCVLDDSLDVNINFLQKNQLQQTYLRLYHRFCLRLMDSTAVVLLLFTDAQP